MDGYLVSDSRIDMAGVGRRIDMPNDVLYDVFCNINSSMEGETWPDTP
jgi:hypothetical protein